MRRRRSVDTVMALRYDVEAVASDLADWCHGKVEPVAGGPPVVWVPTTYGPRPALRGDWIVRRGADDFRPYSPHDFRAGFSQVGDDDVAGLLGGALSA